MCENAPPRPTPEADFEAVTRNTKVDGAIRLIALWTFLHKLHVADVAYEFLCGGQWFFDIVFIDRLEPG